MCLEAYNETYIFHFAHQTFLLNLITKMLDAPNGVIGKNIFIPRFLKNHETPPKFSYQLMPAMFRNGRIPTPLRRALQCDLPGRVLLRRRVRRGDGVRAARAGLQGHLRRRHIHCHHFIAY